MFQAYTSTHICLVTDVSHLIEERFLPAKPQSQGLQDLQQHLMSTLLELESEVTVVCTQLRWPVVTQRLMGTGIISTHPVSVDEPLLPEAVACKGQLQQRTPAVATVP